MSGPSGSSSNGDDGQSRTQIPPSGAQLPPIGTADTKDPALSLRAAALLTLKSKRKKLPNDSDSSATLGPRNRISARSTIQLDYGQDDSSSTALPPQSNSLATATTDTASSPSLREIDDPQAREEGEISDSEAAAATKLQPPLKRDINKFKQSDTKTRLTEPISYTMHVPSKSDKTDVKIKTEPASPTMARLKTAPLSPPVPSTPPGLDITSARSEHDETLTPFIIDENHVRPWIALNQKQYDTAKDIVLDLLGWGVSPDYLLDCGLSRELVFYVFTELRLRLPANLDPTDIPPYTPQLLRSAYYEGPNPGSSTTGKSVLRPQTHSHLPLKPSTPQGLASSSTHSTLSSSATPFQPSSQLDVSPSLHDIEQQRRRELLARKAVLASWKTRHTSIHRTPSPSPSPTASSVNEPIKDVEMVAAATVDDFLNSIGPGDDQNASQTSTSVDADKVIDPPPRTTTPTAMDIDEIPGFVTSEGSGAWTSLSSLTFSSLEASSTYNNNGASVLAAGPFSADSSQSVMSLASDQSDMKSNLNASVIQNGDIAPRRGTKRPVAADFVEYDGDQVLASNGNTNHFGPPFSRRKLGSFASVSGMRRCVIDLSDSEDDGFEDNGLYRNSIQSPYSIPTRQASWLASIGSTVTLPHIGTQVPPAALLEKEQEIKRMREMIAQREQSRLRKLVMSSRNTPVESLPLISTPSARVDTPSVVPTQSTPTTPAPVDRVDEGLPTTVTVNGARDPGREEPSQPAKSADPSAMSISAEGSSSSSPTDIAHNESECSNAGNQVIIDEGQQEVVDARLYEENSSEDQDAVEVDGVAGFETSSTEEQEQEQEQVSEQVMEDRETTSDGWTTYHSPLESYPLIRWHSQIAVDVATSTSELTDPSLSHQTACTSEDPSWASSSRSISTSTTDWPDLKVLKTSIACKTFDSERRICQYEVPGGGECRDAQCKDMHVSRASVMEPGDDDTAQYLYDNLPVGLRNQGQPSVKVIKDALEDVRRKKGMTMIYDDRVAMALSMLGLR